jgi:hypothetical protein
VKNQKAAVYCPSGDCVTVVYRSFGKTVRRCPCAVGRQEPFVNRSLGKLFVVVLAPSGTKKPFAYRSFGKLFVVVLTPSGGKETVCLSFAWRPVRRCPYAVGRQRNRLSFLERPRVTSDGEGGANPLFVGCRKKLKILDRLAGKGNTTFCERDKRGPKSGCRYVGLALAKGELSAEAMRKRGGRQVREQWSNERQSGT